MISPSRHKTHRIVRSRSPPLHHLCLCFNPSSLHYLLSPACRCPHTLPRIHHRLHTGFNGRNASMPPPYSPRTSLSQTATLTTSIHPRTICTTLLWLRLQPATSVVHLSRTSSFHQATSDQGERRATSSTTPVSPRTFPTTRLWLHLQTATPVVPLSSNPPGLFSDQGRKEGRAQKSYRPNHQGFPPGTLVASRVTRRLTGSPAQARSRDALC